MAKFIKKPIPIEATQWFKHGDHPNVQVRSNVPEHFNHKCEKCGHYTDEHGDIKTLEGKGGAQEVCPGDWIITGIQGENYPCKPAIFAATYDLVEEPINRQLDIADAADYSYGRDPYTGKLP